MVALVFRGTDTSENIQDYIDGAANQHSHYSHLTDLIDFALAYAQTNGITKILVAGHSLGAAMAEYFSTQASQHPLASGIDFSIVTFGSPGIPITSSGDGLPQAVLSLQHTGDPVTTVPSQQFDLVFNGILAPVSLPMDGGTSFLEQLFFDHSMERYLETARIVSASESASLIVSGSWNGPIIVGREGLVDVLAGSGASEIILGGSGNDVLSGAGGNDVIDGGPNNDTMRGGPGNDIIYGGDGDLDTATFDFAVDFYFPPQVFGNRVTVTTRPGILSLDTDTLYDVEYLSFVGGQIVSVEELRAAQELSAGTAQGGHASDGGIASAGGGPSSNDGSTSGAPPTGVTKVGNESANHLYGTSGPDTFQGLGGDDVLTGYSGLDTFDGGDGSDTVDYSYNPASVSGTVDLTTGTAFFPGFFTEQLTSIENVWMGAGDDVIVGSSGSSTMVLKPGPEGQDLWINNTLSYGDNYGVDNNQLLVGGWGDSYHSLLGFDLSSTNQPPDLTSATLRLYAVPYGDNRFTPTGLYVDELHTAWSESYGWHDYGLSSTNIGSVASVGSGWVDIDITTAVEHWLANPSQNFGILLRPFGIDANMDEFVSSDATGNLAQFRPELVLQFSTSADNDLRGGPGDDTLTGGLGNDVIYGDWRYSDQGGNDTAIISYTFGSGYTVSGSANALHIVGAEGDDWYHNIENFQFAGGITKTAAEVLGEAPFTSPQSIQRVAAASDAAGANSTTFSLSADGRYLVFSSTAPNLVTGDTNGDWDVFVRDLQTGSITRVSTDASGAQSNGDGTTGFPVISGDGRHVAFMSKASNLVPGDNNALFGGEDVFLKDLQTGAISLVSTNSGGMQGNNTSHYPSISGNGRFVTFQSSANNLVPDDNNNWSDVFIKDLLTSETTLVSSDADDAQGHGASYSASISANGRYVAFASSAPNLVSQDTNSIADVFVKDMATGLIVRANTDANGNQGQTNGSFSPNLNSGPFISADGRYVAYSSQDDRLIPSSHINIQNDVYIKDLLTGALTRASTDVNGVQGNGDSFVLSISANGRYVAFQSNANNLVSGDTNSAYDVFVKDLQTGSITRVSTDASGLQGNAGSGAPSISADGRLLAFISVADNLAPGDTNGIQDIFVVDRRPNVAPTANDDVALGSEYSHLSGNVLIDNGNGTDSDGDGDSLTVVAVNGLGANVSQSVTLTSGALLTVNPDGRFVYNPNGAFHALTSGQTDTDGFTYTISDGQGHTDTATVTITINGQDDGLVITGGPGDESFAGTSQEDQINGAGGNDTIHGAAAYDWLQGGPGSDTLHGEGGSDVLDGGSEADAMAGGPDHDIYIVDNAGDVVTENSSEGTDTVQTALAFYQLGDNVENLTFTNGGAHTGLGNALANVLTGGTGNDTIFAENTDTVIGGAGTDFLYVVNSNPFTIDMGAAGIEWILSGGGDDTLNGATQTAVMTVYAGDGSDVITGGSNNDALFGQGGNDTIVGGAGNDLILGESGVDSLSGGANSDTIFAESTDSLIDGGAGQDFVYIGDNGNVSLDMGARGIEWILSGGGSDTLNAGTQAVVVTVYAGEGADIITGGSNNDALFGQGGGDTIAGGAGNDILFGEGGSDSLSGGADSDTIFAESTDSLIDGGTGQDFVYIGDNGTVTLDMGARGVEWILSGGGDDTLNAGTQTAVVTVYAGSGADIITGGSNNDALFGQANNDTIVGGTGDDVIFGEGGTDTLTGGSGFDYLVGGSEADTFVFGVGWQTDTVADFQNGADLFDMTALAGSGVHAISDLIITTSGADAGIFWNGNFIQVLGAAGQIDAGDFIFA